MGCLNHFNDAVLIVLEKLAGLESSAEYRKILTVLKRYSFECANV